MSRGRWHSGACNGGSRNITRTLQRRYQRPLRAPVDGVLSATVVNEGAKPLPIGRWLVRLRKELGACTQPAFRRTGGGDL